MASNKPCQKCGLPAADGLRFCEPCEAKIRAEMIETGYLTPEPAEDEPRPDEAQEVIAETKFGVDEWAAGIEFEETVERL